MGFHGSLRIVQGLRVIETENRTFFETYPRLHIATELLFASYSMPSGVAS